MPIDAIFTIYEIGFTIFYKENMWAMDCSYKWRKIFQLHKKMAIATEVMKNTESIFLLLLKIVFKERNFSKKLVLLIINSKFMKYNLIKKNFYQIYYLVNY